MPSKKGYDKSMLLQKSEPNCVILPDFINRSTDLTEILGQASSRLNVDAVPESIPCRDSEYHDIFNFIEDKLIHKKGGCLYVCGCPGTGNSAIFDCENYD